MQTQNNSEKCSPKSLLNQNDKTVVKNQYWNDDLMYGVVIYKK